MNLAENSGLRAFGKIALWQESEEFALSRRGADASTFQRVQIFYRISCEANKDDIRQSCAASSSAVQQVCRLKPLKRATTLMSCVPCNVLCTR